MNSSVGSIAENSKKIIEMISNSEKKNADLIIFPELALSGYLPLDQLLYSSFMDLIDKELDEIKRNVGDSTVILGTPRRDDLSKNIFRNSVVVINQGRIIEEIDKTLMPNYDVFGESRYFRAGTEPKLIIFKGIKIGIQICEDMWDHLPHHQVNVTKVQKEMGAKLIINISASPFSKSKAADRLTTVKNHVRQHDIPFIYINLVGGQDEIVFDGRSFLVNNTGQLVFSAPIFEEGHYIVKSSLLVNERDTTKSVTYQEEPIEKEIAGAITLNLRDYLKKIIFKGKLIIALSGGIDSALTAVLAVNAVSKERVVGIYMPSKYSSIGSKQDADKLGTNLGIEYHAISINHINEQYNIAFENVSVLSSDWSVADENIQARIRANILMYFANQNNGIVISTGNKSEIAVGYCTLYGDTVGGKNLIGDLYKHEVYKLGRYLNSIKYVIPEASFTKAPSAELRSNQKDTDSLPDYPVLDFILEKLIDENLSIEEISKLGQPKELVNKVAIMVRQSEFKRAQIAQTVKISDRAFGRGRIIPIATGFIP